MSSIFFPTFIIQSVMYILTLQEAKVQVITMKGAFGDCHLLNLENRKPAANIHEVVWKKGTVLMGKMKSQSAAICKIYSERCHVFNNGSLSLCPTIMEDEGQYTADVFTEDGKHLYSQTVQLELIEDKVEDITIKGTLGDCQLLNLENNRKLAASIHEVVWKKGIDSMGTMKGQTATTCERYSERCHVFNNGSLRLCPTLKGDDGQYTADVLAEDGKLLYSRTFQLELTKSERTTSYHRLFFFILMGLHVAIFLVVLVSSTYHFRKWKNKPENKSRTVQKPQAMETIEESQRNLFNQLETAAEARHNIEYSVPLKISTFKGKAISFL